MSKSKKRLRPGSYSDRTPKNSAGTSVPSATLQTEAPDKSDLTPALGTQQASSFAIDLIRSGLGDLRIIDRLCEEYGLAVSTARRSLDLAYTRLATAHTSRNSQQLLAKALEQREQLLEAASEKGDTRTALALLESRDKLLAATLIEQSAAAETLLQLALDAREHRDVI